MKRGGRILARHSTHYTRSLFSAPPAVSAHRPYTIDIGQRSQSRALSYRRTSSLAALFTDSKLNHTSTRARRTMSGDSNANGKEVKSFYDLAPIDNKGKPYPFTQLKGKVVLIVNVASQCGFTKQYKDLEQLYREYKDREFVILGFPCNQFGGQEPGNDDEIASFCSVNFGVSFPILHKIDVNGPHADPVYQWLKSKKSGFLGFSGIKWNFEKFLVDSQGNVVNRWASTTSPSSLKGDIEKLLPATS